MPRDLHSIDDLRAMLRDRIEDLIDALGLRRSGTYIDQRTGYFYGLNPARADNSTGSFIIHTRTSARAPRGNWHDFATNQGGGPIDLIMLALSCDQRAAFIYARQFLGLATMDPAEQARLKQRLADAEAQRQADRKRQQVEAAEARRRAYGLWVNSHQQIRDTPVDAYLRGRCIDLSVLQFQPGALRYHPALNYRDIDRATGEVIEGQWPAMMALIQAMDGTPMGVHRTWLAPTPRGWGKAPVPKPKKVWGEARGHHISISKGLGPRGGKGAQLRQAEPGTHVYLTEGIEDALSALVLLGPEARILACYSLDNLGAVRLPKAVSRVTIIADRDPGKDEQERLARVIDTHSKAGRQVDVWLPSIGKDLNDQLRATMAGQTATGAA